MAKQKPGNKAQRRASASSAGTPKQHQSADTMPGERPGNPFYRRSVLVPQAERWQADLPVQWLEQGVEPNAIWLNEKNDIWLEIPRYENQISWGMGGIIIFMSALAMFVCFFTFFWGLYQILIIQVCFFVFFSSMLVWNIRMNSYVPRGTPVRLNRKRQKIYIYEHRRSWNPWTEWPVEIRVFHWDEVRGEITFEAGRSHQGYQLHGAVCQPGTNRVRERFALTWTVGDPEALRELWCYCCRYMQHQPVPEEARFAEHPQQWGHIHWPEEMDTESRTAP